MKEHLKVLLIEDKHGDARLIQEMLKNVETVQFEIDHVERLKNGMDRISDGSYDIVLLDLGLPDADGPNTFHRLQTQAPEIPIVVMTGLDDEKIALTAVREGAQDWLVKGKEDSNVLGRSIRYAIERKQTALKLQEAYDRMEFLNDLLSHDINNINQGIVFILGFLLKKSELSDPTKEMLQSALNQINRSSELITNIKNVTQISAESIELTKMDIAPIFYKAVDTVNETFPQKTMNLTSNIKEGSHYAIVNEFLLDLFVNLLHNAMKFTETSQVDIEADISSSGKFIKIEISDYGPGILDEIKSNIFVRYRHRDTNLKSTGIGLTLVKYIIDSYNGKIQVEDRIPGDYTKGASFKLYIPQEY